MINLPEIVYETGERALHGYPFAGVDHLDAASDVINNVASLIVATELRRIATTWSDKDEPAVMNVPPSYVHRSLQRRADELDPEGLTA